MSDTSTTLADSPQSQSDLQTLAPAWHTAGVLLLLVGLVGLSMSMRAGHTHHRLLGYSISIAAEWLIVGFIWLGARWGGPSLRTLAGAIAPSWRSILRDIGLAIAYLVVANILLGGISFLLARLLGPSKGGSLQNMLPQGGLENVVFLLLAVTAGFCEETIFRGYLQRHFTAWTRSAVAGIAAQGILFGVAHAYQGLNMIVVIAFYGCFFGLLANWRKSLRPGMIAHFVQDGVGGLLLARHALR